MTTVLKLKTPTTGLTFSRKSWKAEYSVDESHESTLHNSHGDHTHSRQISRLFR